MRKFRIADVDQDRPRLQEWACVSMRALDPAINIANHMHGAEPRIAELIC
jgi:hypothetical protein